MLVFWKRIEIHGKQKLKEVIFWKSENEKIGLDVVENTTLDAFDN